MGEGALEAEAEAGLPCRSRCANMTVCKSSSPATPERVLPGCSRRRPRTFAKAIDKVAADSTAPNNNLRALKSVPNGFRIRIGAGLRSNWRVSYTLDRQAGVMSVFEIAPRGGAYR